MSDPTTSKKQKMASIRDRLNPDTLLKISFDGKEEEPPRFLIAYWSIRGLGAPIRAMLHAAQVNHEVALYDKKEASDGGGWDMDSYLAGKKWLREEFDSFMNLPFLVDNQRGIVLAQTNSIFQYLSRELDMDSKDDPVQQAKIDEMLCETMDLRDKMVGFAYRTECTKEDAEAMMKRAKAHLRKFEAHLSKKYPDFFKNLKAKEVNGAKTSTQAKEGIAHLIPGKFTAPDFHLWEMLDQYEALCKQFGFSFWSDKGNEQSTAIDFQSRPDIKPLEDRLYPHLEEFRICFALLAENVDYLDSYLHKEIPCNNPMAKFASCCKDYRGYTRGQETPWRNKGVIEIKYKTTASS